MLTESPALLADPKDADVQPLSAEALRQLLDASSAIVAVKDLAGRYLYVNRAFLSLTGGDAGDYLGRTDLEIFPRAMAKQLRANDRQVLAEGREREFEEALEIHGTRRIYRVRKYPLVDAEGTPWAVCLSAEDITESRRTDQALRRVALGISAASGPEVFDLTVSNVAAVLGVDLAFVASLEADDASARLSTLAVCEMGEIGGRYGYQVAGTACAEVLARGFNYYSECAAARFKADEMLAAAGYVSYAGYPLLDARGAPAGVLSVCHRGALPPAAMVESVLAVFAVRTAAELERVRMDRALRDSELSYRTIFEASEDCIFIHDFATGAIVDVNARACEIYGYDRETILRLTPGDLSTGEPPFTQDDAARHIARARAGEVVRVEWHRRNADGSTAWDEVCLKRVRLAGVDRILAVTRDITERKAREQALARSENRLRATVDAALDCIIIMDGGGRVREFNPAAEACFGYRRDVVLGRPLADLIVPARFRQAHLQGMERYLRDGTARMLGRRVELTAKRADGSEFPVELAITEAEGADGMVFIGYLRDITLQRKADDARAELEAQLRQAQKMEAIGHLTGGVAHDFNNILTGIMGYLGMAEEIAQAGGNTRLQHYLQRARQSGVRATELIQQMLTFSRGRRGDPRVLPPAPLVLDALRLVRATLPSSVVLSTELDEEDVPAVLFDPVQLEQVLMNLCINARDAMRGQGTIDVRLRPVDLADVVCSSCQKKTSGPYVELAVTDNGPGVPAAILPRMFEPFFTTKAPGQGSGMGLATVHGIVHEHHGHVVVENRATGGVSFRVLLPALELTAEPAALQDSDGRDEPLADTVLRGRVLLVDDDDAVREFMTDLLQAWGLEVISFDDPLQAHATAMAGASFDIAILDYTMPHMTGLELARHLHGLHSPPAMFLYSGYADGLEDDEVAAAGIRARLAKPIDAQELYHQLESVLDPD
jgi:PAS domain S-box-containing protein